MNSVPFRLGIRDEDAQIRICAALSPLKHKSLHRRERKPKPTVENVLKEEEDWQVSSSTFAMRTAQSCRQLIEHHASQVANSHVSGLKPLAGELEVLLGGVVNMPTGSRAAYVQVKLGGRKAESTVLQPTAATSPAEWQASLWPSHVWNMIPSRRSTRPLFVPPPRTMHLLSLIPSWNLSPQSICLPIDVQVALRGVLSLEVISWLPKAGERSLGKVAVPVPDVREFGYLAGNFALTQGERRRMAARASECALQMELRWYPAADWNAGRWHPAGAAWTSSAMSPPGPGSYGQAQWLGAGAFVPAPANLSSERWPSGAEMPFMQRRTKPEPIGSGWSRAGTRSSSDALSHSSLREVHVNMARLDKQLRARHPGLDFAPWCVALPSSIPLILSLPPARWLTAPYRTKDMRQWRRFCIARKYR